MSKKKKVRVAFRKNRQTRTRDNDLTRRFEAGEIRGSDPVAAERVRAKGALSRHRTVMQEVSEETEAGESEDPRAALAVDLWEGRPGRVLRVLGLESVVQADEGRRYRCGVRRVLKNLAIDARNVVAVGDRVWFRPGGENQGLIEKVEPRTGTVTRGYRHREHVIVSNVDQLLIVSAFAEPELKLPLIDRYLISAEKGGVRPIIVLNKADLVDLAAYQWVFGLYAQLGYEVISCSASRGLGVERLREETATGSTGLSGQSGVRRIALKHDLQPHQTQKLGEDSSVTRKGKHTTTYAELLKLEQGGYVVDTPGLRQFELWDVEPWELEQYFIEFRPYIPHCRFPDCSHIHESDCAVKEALARDQIHEGRYESYLKLYHQQPIEGE